MKIMVLGADGMLGHKMVERLGLYFSSDGITRKDGFNAEFLTDCEDILRDKSPDVVINCIGVIKQREQDTERSIRVNALFPHFLEKMCREMNARLIHFSTDCVFSGNRGQYTETDIPDPQDDYGRTKLLGELGVPALTLRTSIIGREKSNFKGLLEWFLREGRYVKGFDNVVFSGVTTNWLADVVANLLITGNNITGLYHVAAPPVSKYRLLEIFNEVYRRDAQIYRTYEPKCDRSLIGTKFEQATGIVAPSLEVLVRLQRDQDKESGYAVSE